MNRPMWVRLSLVYRQSVFPPARVRTDESTPVCSRAPRRVSTRPFTCTSPASNSSLACAPGAGEAGELEELADSDRVSGKRDVEDRRAGHLAILPGPEAPDAGGADGDHLGVNGARPPLSGWATITPGMRPRAPTCSYRSAAARVGAATGTCRKNPQAVGQGWADGFAALPQTTAFASADPGPGCHRQIPS